MKSKIMEIQAPQGATSFENLINHPISAAERKIIRIPKKHMYIVLQSLLKEETYILEYEVFEVFPHLEYLSIGKFFYVAYHNVNRVFKPLC